MLNESNIRCFLMLAQTLNFTAAARELHFSQQTISKNVSKLETDLGTKLFVRNHHTVALTEDGKEYRDLFVSFYRRFFALQREILHSQSPSQARIRVGFQEELDFGQLLYYTDKAIHIGHPDFCQHCERQSPQVLLNQLFRGDLDLVVLYERFLSRPEAYETRELCQLCEILMVADHYPLKGASDQYKSLNDTPLIFDSSEESFQENELTEQARSCMNRLGLVPSEVLVVANRSTAFSEAEQGNVFVVTTEISNLARRPHMKQLKTGLYESLVAVWKKDCQNAIVEEYVDTLRQQFAISSDREGVRCS